MMGRRTRRNGAAALAHRKNEMNKTVEYSVVSDVYNGAQGPAYMLQHRFTQDRILEGKNCFIDTYECLEPIYVGKIYDHIMKNMIPALTLGDTQTVEFPDENEELTAEFQTIEYTGKYTVMTDNKNVFFLFQVVTSGELIMHMSATSKKVIDDFIGELRHKFTDKSPTVKWYYLSDHGTRYKNITINKDYELHDAYYPYIKDGIKKFNDEYLKSTASILFMVGDPGTGKTSYIRNLIIENKLRAIVTYDDKLLESDDFMLQFLLKDEHDILVVEDADALLTPREKDGNKGMSKLLNTSDGLVKIFGKKVIFTTNITQMSKIDEALLRPGRCHAAVMFRHLTYAQTKVAAEVAGIPVPEKEKDYTLGELFNHQAMMAGKTKIGFFA
jgi:hypothetical protein